MRTYANIYKQLWKRSFILVVLIATVVATSTHLQASQTGTCGTQMTTIPFDDVLPGNAFFCPIAEAFFSGLTNGTTSSTYSPGNIVPREQMAAFVTRTLDQSLRRGSRHAALKESWTPKNSFDIPLTSVGFMPDGVACDGSDLWVANHGAGNGNGGTVSRVRASDGKLLETWTGAEGARRVLVAKGLIYVLADPNNSAKLYRIDPTQPAGTVTTLNVSLGLSAGDIAFDGDRIWIASNGVFLMSFSQFCSPCVTPVVTNVSTPVGLVYDGANMWVTDIGDNQLKKLDAAGNVIQAVPINLTFPSYPVFDGTNIWVPGPSDPAVTVVRAATGAVVATLTGNGLSVPREAAFDGERILVTDYPAQNGNTVSLWKATDLSPLGSVQVSSGLDGVAGVCSDGLDFWITLRLADKLARF